MAYASKFVSGRGLALAVLLLLARPPGARAITGLTETLTSGNNKFISLLTDGVPDMIRKADSQLADDSQMMADSPFKYNHYRDLSPG